MIPTEQARLLLLSLPQVIEMPHFDKASFRVNKKIYATLNSKENRACIKLPEVEQSVFCSFDTKVIYPVPNKWGKQGWTLINLNLVTDELFLDAIKVAYCNVAPKNLAESINFDSEE
jgi:predicted DNA-binding protein (MmcQ/YjbR family)